jgi:hypothetical protein
MVKDGGVDDGSVLAAGREDRVRKGSGEKGPLRGEEPGDDDGEVVGGEDSARGLEGRAKVSCEAEKEEGGAHDATHAVVDGLGGKIEREGVAELDDAGSEEEVGVEMREEPIELRGRAKRDDDGRKRQGHFNAEGEIEPGEKRFGQAAPAALAKAELADGCAGDRVHGSRPAPEEKEEQDYEAGQGNQTLQVGAEGILRTGHAELIEERGPEDGLNGPCKEEAVLGRFNAEPGIETGRDEKDREGKVRMK